MRKTIIKSSPEISGKARSLGSLRESRLQHIIDSAPLGIGIVVNRVFIEVNSTFCKMLGYSENELLGKNARIIYPSDEEYEYVGTIKYDIIKKHGIGTVNTKLQHKNGRILDVLMSSWKTELEHENGTTFTVIDITEQKRLENVLKKANYELEERDVVRAAELLEINKSLKAEIEGRKLSESNLRTSQKNLRAMVSEVAITEERSRQHFATDLHDSVVQTLAAAKLRSQLIQREIPKKIKPIFTELQNLLSEGIIQARSIMAELSPPVLNELGFLQALEWIAEQMGKKHNLAIDYECRIQSASLPREIEIMLFQATRELLMNVVKHSQTQNASLKIYSNGQKLCIEISDQGCGFDMKETLQPDSKGGFGLYGIRERLRHIGGQLVIKSKPSKGTTVLILCPAR